MLNISTLYWSIHPKDTIQMDIEKNCKRCLYKWNSGVEFPIRCPSCGTYHWNDDSVTNRCYQCGHEWFQRTENTPLRCPNCKTRSWMEGSIDRRKRSNHSSNPGSDKIRDMYGDGEGCVSISIKTGIPVATVLKVVKEDLPNGVGPRL